MATNTQATSSSRFRAGDEVLQLHRAHLAFFVGEVVADGGVPDRLDLRIRQRAVGHDFRGPQLVAAVDQIDLAGETGEEIRLLAGAVAAADHADRHVAVKRAVAGGAGGQAVADEFLLARQARGGGAPRRWRRSRSSPRRSRTRPSAGNVPSARRSTDSTLAQAMRAPNFSACACIFIINSGPMMPSG